MAEVLIAGFVAGILVLFLDLNMRLGNIIDQLARIADALEGKNGKRQ